MLEFDNFDDKCKIYQNDPMSMSIISRYGKH